MQLSATEKTSVQMAKTRKTATLESQGDVLQTLFPVDLENAYLNTNSAMPSFHVAMGATNLLTFVDQTL
jgi:hypothetical protein